MAKKLRNRERPIIPNTGQGPSVYDAPPSTRETVPTPEAAPQFALNTGDRLVHSDGRYLAVVASANINGAPHVILQAHNADGSRAPHPQNGRINAGHAPLPLAEAERMVAAGEVTLGHGPK